MFFQCLRDFVNSLIDFPKPLVAAVNGPAVGIMVTTLSLCDLIYCCESVSRYIFGCAIVYKIYVVFIGYFSYSIYGAWSESRGLFCLHVSKNHGI